MQVLVYGASGNIGRAIAAELVDRGHDVVAATRTGGPIAGVDIPVVSSDAADTAAVAEAAAGKDAVVSAVGPRLGVEPDERSMFGAAAHALLDGMRKAGVRRLLVVGGAASLEVAPGQRLIDSPHFPPAWLANAQGQMEALDIYRQVDDLDWTYISPPASIDAGERRGTYRTGGEQLVVDHLGESRISYRDYALALVDELEQGSAIRRRMTVAY